MLKHKPLPWVTGGLVFFCLTVALPLKLLASCEEDCEVPRSCKEYLECRVSYMECLAACKQKEAWELYAKSSEKSIAATERMAQILENTFRMSEKITLLLDKLITNLTQQTVPQQTVPGNPQETQENPAPLPEP